jgi:hypothetical protein
MLKNKNSYEESLRYSRILMIFFINGHICPNNLFYSKFFIIEINTKFLRYRELLMFYPIKNTNKGEIQ